jgi:SAM-dependent methyltransferase
VSLQGRPHRRDFASILDALPPVDGRLVMDLGCGNGDVAEQLVARGARVVGVDLNEELLADARARELPGTEFVAADLREPFRVPVEVDGIWASFLAAYFVDLTPALERWAAHLPGGWIALTEVDDLFAHSPLEPRTRELLEAYAGDAFAQGRYDFRMGSKLTAHLAAAGFRVTRELTLDDRELAFQGPATPDILASWRRRLDRMTLLHDFCGPEKSAVREDLLACLASPAHECTARVLSCVALR